MNAEEIFHNLTFGLKLDKRKKPVFDTPDEINQKKIKLMPSIPANDEGKPKKQKKLKFVAPEKAAKLRQEQINHIRKANKIHVYGTDIPALVESFEELRQRYNLSPKLVENISKAGYNVPTPVQMQVLTTMMERRETLACAPTGSGKTAAFVIPIIHDLKEPRNTGFRALLLAPTRELAQQTYRECVQLSNGLGLRVSFTEKPGKDVKKGVKRLRHSDILVATPNRLLYLLKQDTPLISLASVEWLIIDESDKLFEEGKRGFRDQLAEIYQSCDSGKIRRGLFSATFAQELEQWCLDTLDNLLRVYIGNRNAATELVEQELVYVGCEAGKMVAMRDIIRKGLKPPVLIFMQSKERAKELFAEMVYDGLYVSAIHADMPNQQREKITTAFRLGKIWVLICTDLMGRGLDFKGIQLVINYDFPNSAVSYIHRIGRTGRAGRPGKAVTFFADADAPLLRSIANVLKEAGCPVPDYLQTYKKPDKKTRKRLANKVPQRETIRTYPKAEIDRAKKRREKVKQKLKGKKDEVYQEQTESSALEVDK